MSEEISTATPRDVIPDGYDVLPPHSGLGKLLGPFYIKENATVGEDGVTRVGLKLDDKHGGGPGHGHGGVTMSLLDEVMGRSASLAVDALCVTISMNTNFCNGSLLGDFLIARAHVSHRSRKMVFLEGTIHAGDTLIATSNGVWKNSGVPIPGNFPE